MKMDESPNYYEKRSTVLWIGRESIDLVYENDFEDWVTIFAELICEEEDLQVVEMLIRGNRKLWSIENRSGKTALHIAAENGKVGVINLILTYCPESVTAATMETCLHVAVMHKQIDVLSHLLNWVTGERPDLFHVFDFKDYRGKTVLQLFQNDDAQTTDEPANYCEKELNGPLIWNYKIANLLLACKMGHLEMVEELILENRKLCFEKDGFGRTALHIAAENGKVDVINLILRYCPEAVKEVTDKTRETCLHVAVKNNQIDVVLCLLKWVTGERPDFLHVLDFKDYKRKLDVQFSEQFQMGHLGVLQELILENRKLCFEKDGFGKTALHIAAENGKVDVINLILRYCPEAVKEVTDKTRETCLHMAVKNNQIDVVLCLLKWVTRERPDFLHVLDFKDYKRKLAVQFSEQFQALRVFLPLNSGGSVAIDISYDLSYLTFLGICWEPRPMITWDLTKHKIKHTDDYSQRGLPNFTCYLTGGKMKQNDNWEPRSMMTWDLTKNKIQHTRDYDQRGLTDFACYLTEEKIKQNDNCSPRGLSNGSRDLTEEKIKRNDNCSPRGLSNSSRDFTIQIIKPNDDYSHRGLLNWSSNRSIVEPSVRFRTGLLLVAALIATTTFQVPFRFLSSSSKDGYEQHSIMRSLIISCNSLVFIASVGVITFLLHEFPLKPLPHSLILALFGCYMLSLNAIMPNGALALFFISIPILLVGICREALWFCKPKTHLSTSGDVSSC